MNALRMLGALLVGIVIGALGMYLWPADTIVETHAPAERQADGSLTLERDPAADIKPAHQVPKGGKVEREIRVEVQPAARPDCPICTVDLSLVRMPDATHRVVASSPDGRVVSGLDVPLVPATIEQRRNWLAGAFYNGRWGGLVGHRFGPVFLGGAVTTNRDDIATPWVVLLANF